MSKMGRLAWKSPGKTGLFVCDDAYAGIAIRETDPAAPFQDAVKTRALSKSGGLEGINYKRAFVVYTPLPLLLSSCDENPPLYRLFPGIDHALRPQRARAGSPTTGRECLPALTWGIYP